MSPRRLPRFVVRASAVVLAAPALSAQAVSGRVVDRGTGRPIPGLMMGLLRATADDTAARSGVVAPALDTARTAADGVFMLTAPDTGSYRVRFGLEFVAPAVHLARRDSLDAREYRLVVDSLGPCVAPRPLEVADSVQEAGGALCEYEVTQRAQMVPGTLRPPYPNALRGRADGGSVMIRFVIDTTGRAEWRTAVGFRATDTEPEFLAVAAAALPAARFRPAERRGRRVRQLVWLPLTFLLNDAGRSASLPNPTARPPLGAPAP